MPDRSPPSGPSATEELRVARIGDRSVTYVLRRSGRARGLRLTVDRTRGVVATVPLARRGSWARPHGAVEAFLVQRAGWVERHLARFERERALLAERGRVVDGGLLRYRGELHRLRVGTAGPRDGSPVQRRQDAQDDEAVLRRGEARRGSTVLRRGEPRGGSTVLRRGGLLEDELVVILARGERRPPGAVLEGWLRARAEEAIDRQIARHASPLGVRPTTVVLRDPRTRWASASSDGRLMFSWRLVLAPPEALETVVVHELAHLRVLGHGPDFWALVASRRPDHAVWRRWLREHAFELHAALRG